MFNFWGNLLSISSLVRFKSTNYDLPLPTDIEITIPRIDLKFDSNINRWHLGIKILQKGQECECQAKYLYEDIQGYSTLTRDNLSLGFEKLANQLRNFK